MNFVFLSPHFPAYPTDFCYQLRQLGANILGIGDTEYENLNDKLKTSLTDYYKVGSMENYDELFKAVAYFTWRYGRIDRFESLNEHWLETEAKIRTDFNIYGPRIDFVYNLKRKSKMKEFFHKAGVRAPRCRSCTDKESARAFIAEAGYPIILKPDIGSGANWTYKINTELDLDNFFNQRPVGMEFIMDEYVDGVIETFDGLVDRDGIVRFAASHYFDRSIMDVVNTDDHLYYYSLRRISPDIEDAGRKILKAYDVRERFFHLEIFRSKKDGRVSALEVNMRPPGGWVTDAMNFSHDMDVYREWADMVLHNRVGGPFTAKYFTGYASRKNHKNYAHTHAEILWKYRDFIVKYSAMEDILSRTAGNYAYQFRSPELAVIRQIIGFIHEEK